MQSQGCLDRETIMPLCHAGHVTKTIAHEQSHVYLSQVADRAIATVQAVHNTSIDRRVGIVRLNGLLHVDERCAFQEIAKQLCRQVVGQQPQQTFGGPV